MTLYVQTNKDCKHFEEKPFVEYNSRKSSLNFIGNYDKPYF